MSVSALRWQDDVWPEYLRFREELVGILDLRLYSAEWLDGEVWSGRMFLFTEADAAILCSLKLYPTGLKECHVEAAAGELRSLTDRLIHRVEQWALKTGCALVTIQSRAGWERLMKPQGYNRHQVAIRKEIA